MGIDKFVLEEDCTLREALRHMDWNSIKYAVAADSSGRIIGTITDGDIRRGILRGVSLDDPISEIANRNFQSIQENEDYSRIVAVFQERRIDFIPILDGNGRLKNLMTRHILNAMLLTNEKLSLNFDFDKIDRTTIEYEISVRPWGYYKTMVLNEMFQSKVIYVQPQQSLSLQSHKRRDEYWTVINGSGRVQLDDDVKKVSPGDMFYIPRGCKHRMINDSKNELLVFSEVQLGDYFGEDDIYRYEDKYGRI